jgi:uncharacterized protein
MSRLVENLLVFGRILRRAGIDVHPGRLVDVVDALGHVNLGSRDEVYHTCRSLLVHRREQIGIFDRAFAAFWREHEDERAPAAAPNESTKADLAQPKTVEADEPVGIARADAENGIDTDADTPLQTWSDVAALATKDFGTFTPDEIALARAALLDLVWNPGERRTRRWVAGRGPRIDLRRAIAESLRSGGEVVKLPRRQRRVHSRPLVLLCDVSGSMERYSRMLLHFAHAVTWRYRTVEAFLFSTELTRITRELRSPNLDDSLSAISRAVPDWSGGTKIGSAVREFHQRWSRRVLNGGPVVLLISDGWDRGDPAELGDQIARLQRSCHRLVWLNPLVGTEGYAPLTRGLQAALPFVDDFLPARTLRDLADLALYLNSLTRSTPRAQRALSYAE